MSGNTTTRNSPSPRRRPTPGAPATALVDCGSGVMVERDVRFRLKDGTYLVSDHYYPPGGRGGKPAPTLLVRQPYGRAIATTVVCAQPVWFARHGYNVVIQDVRGRGDSSGRFYPFRDEARDGADTIDWLASRPECNGRIGMYGFSYQGLTQLLAAAEKPAALKCIVPAQTAGDLHSGWFYHHGALRLASTVGWATQMLKSDARRLRARGVGEALEAAWLQLPRLFAQAPYAEIPELSATGLASYYQDWVTRRGSGAWWESFDISARYHDIQIPALHILGWFDTYLHGSAHLFESLRASAGTAPARDQQYLVAGPWTHIPWSRFAGETDFGSEAALDTDQLHLRWFDHWLKDAGTFAHEPKVRLFAQGTQRWHAPTRVSLATLPGARPPYETGAQGLRLHVRSEGRANSAKGDGWLDARAPHREEPRDTWVHEPEVPALSPGPGGAPGQFNQIRSSQLNNVLVYVSQTLEQPVHVCGAPWVDLYVTSRQQQADVFVKLVRHTTDGKALNVCHGIARSSWMFGAGGHTADAIQRWRFELEPTSCVFAAGERIGIEVAGAAFPLYDRNPGGKVAAHLASPRDWKINSQQLVHTPEHPSSIWLPLAE